MQDKITRIILMLKIPIILVSFGIFIYFGYLMQYMEFSPSSSINDILETDAPSVVNYNNFKEEFGSHENLIIGLETDNIYQNDFLEFIINLGNKLKEMEGVEEIFSLATISDIYGKKDELVVEHFIDEEDLPYSDKKLNRMRDYFFKHPFLSNRIVDKDGRAILIHVRLDSEYIENKEKENRKAKIQLANSIMDTALGCIQDESVKGILKITPYFVGDAVVSSEISVTQENEMYISYVMFSVLTIILLLIFRSFFGVAIPIFVALLTLAFVIGLKVLLNSKFSTIDPMLYALIFTISIGDSIHIISAWHSKMYMLIPDKKERILKIMNHNMVPCFFTSLTTAIGFGAISASSIPQLQSFGVFACISVVTAFVLTVTLTPSFMTLFNSKSSIGLSATAKKENFLNRLHDNAVNGITNATYKRPKTIISIFLIGAIISVIGIFQINVGTNNYSFLKDSSPVNIALHFIEDNICGIMDFEIALESDTPDDFKRPELLKKAENLQDYITSLDEITQSNSIIVFIKLLNKAMNENDPSYYKIPETKELIAQYLLLYEISGDAENLGDWISFDYDKIRINFRLAQGVDFANIKNKLNRYMEEHEIPFKANLTGNAELWSKTDEAFIKSQVKSLLITVSSISLILFIIFRSIRLGLYSMIVNFTPVLFGFGFLGFSGIGLNMGTVMISAIAIGIAVDDTIHFIIKYKSVAKVERDLHTIIQKVLNVVIKPIIFTSVILAFGFASNTISSFKPNCYFGLVSAIMLIVAMITDLFLLPSIIVAFAPKKKSL